MVPRVCEMKYQVDATITSPAASFANSQEVMFAGLVSEDPFARLAVVFGMAFRPILVVLPRRPSHQPSARRFPAHEVMVGAFTVVRPGFAAGELEFLFELGDDFRGVLPVVVRGDLAAFGFVLDYRLVEPSQLPERRVQVVHIGIV